MKGATRWAPFRGWARCARRTTRGVRCANPARWRNRSSGELVCATHRRAS